MERLLSFEQLKNEPCFCSVLECHRQRFHGKGSWNGYRSTPRFADGLVLVCSDIRATYRFPDGSTMEGRRGDVFFVPRGLRYDFFYENGSADADMYTVNFLLKDGEGRTIRPGERAERLSGLRAADLLRPVSELADCYYAPERNFLRAQGKFFDLLGIVAERVGERSERYAPIRKGVALLEAEWDRNYKMSRYAEACSISESGFYRQFKAWSGLSPNEYRIDMRIRAARSMLRNSGLSVGEIAARVGFEDPYYFSRLFRKVAGVSPYRYRMGQNAAAETTQSEAIQKEKQKEAGECV